MPQLTDPRKIKTVELKTVEGGTVEVYDSLLAGDSEDLMTEGAFNQEKPKMIRVLQRLIKDWNLTDENDNKLEITEANLRLLLQDDLNNLISEGLSDFFKQAGVDPKQPQKSMSAEQWDGQSKNTEASDSHS